MTPLLAVQNLALSFHTRQGQVNAVRDVNFNVHSNEIVGLIGESGSGKSLTAQSLVQLWPHNPHTHSGKVFFHNRDLLSYSESEMQTIRGKEIGMVFQDPHAALNPTMKIGHQLTEGLRHHQKIKKKEAWQLGIEWLDKMGINDAPFRMNQYPYEFSGGMLQRIMIAMAMICKPSLLIADEPTSALDVTIQAQILDLFMNLRRDFKTGILLITHDLSVVARCCDRVLVMYEGKIIESAPIDELFAKPQHPYTQSMLRCQKSLTEGDERLYTGIREDD